MNEFSFMICVLTNTHYGCYHTHYENGISYNPLRLTATQTLLACASSLNKILGQFVRTIRIYQPGSYQSDQLLELSPEASHHVGLVLRMRPGAPLTLFCGDNYEFEATIYEVRKKRVVVLVGQGKQVSRESPLIVHLGQAISKGERMELVMQKAVELGVADITPIITQYCALKLNKDRVDKKLRQWQGIVIAACEQSGRNVVPNVHEPIFLKDYLQKIQADLKLILHPEAEKRWKDYAIQGKIALLIGPEGGFSQEEIQTSQSYGFVPLSLGPRILRTETAAITALSVLQAVGGDL